MKHLLLWAAVVTSMASCSLQKQTTNTAKTLGIYGAGVIQKPVLTNLKVNPQKIRAVYSSSEAHDMDYHKSQAIAKLMAESKADVIIEPAYEIVQTASTVKITTTGYAGSYENFRQVTAADTALLKDIGIIDYNNSRDEAPPHEAPKKKVKSKGLLALLIVIGIAGAASGGL